MDHGMTPGAWIAIIGIGVTFFLTMLGHIIVSVFWAGKVTAKLDILVRDSGEAKAKLETFRETCFTKADAGIKLSEAEGQHKAIWKKIDAMKHAIIKIFQKEGLDLTQEEL